MQFLVEIYLERKDNVIGVEGLAVGKTEAVAQVHGEHAAILGESPRFGQRGLGLLRCAVDVDQIGRQAADHFTGRGVCGGCRIQRLGLTALADRQNTAVVANFIVGDL